jgi:hypothetical protein
MSKLDEKLEETIKRIDDALSIEEGVSLDYYLTKHDFSSRQFTQAIKQAFIDAGWFTPADEEFVQLVIDHRAQHKAAQPGYPLLKMESIKPGVKVSEPVMTGQEWYERFEKGADRCTHYVRSLFRHGHPSATEADDREMFIKQDILEAAKKASGIE